MSQSYVKKDGNNFYVRYIGGVAYVYADTGDPETDICIACCPKSSLTLWENPNVACGDLRVTHPIDLLSPYFHIHQPITSTLEAGRANNRTAVGAYDVLCGNPPQANLSSIITIQIPYDPIFSGTYSFSYSPNITGWRLITSGPTATRTSLLPYYSGGIDSVRQGPFHNKLLVTLEQTSTEPTYKGYTEVARSGDSNSNISGVFAFPAHFVFSALCPPTDLEYSPEHPFPTTSGHRAVLGFTVPIRWRKEYFDWIVSDAGAHRVSGSKYCDGWSPVFPDPREVPRNYWIPLMNLSPSGYATSISGSNIIGLSGITNNPATYNLSDTSTAISGSCNVSFVSPPTEWSNNTSAQYSGLAHMGFCYRTSASGLPYHDSIYNLDLNNFMGIRQIFNGTNITAYSNYDETRLFGNKQDMEAWITFPNSCRTSGTTCNDLYSILDSITLPPYLQPTGIGGTCIGSYINADFSCTDQTARPDSTYFTNEGITGIKPLYLGTSDNIYPFVKVNADSGNVYMAGSGQNILIDYNGPNTLDGIREWINTEFSFVEISGSNNTIINQWPGVDIYWQKTAGNLANANPNILLARLIPCDSAAYENPSKGLYILKTYNLPFTAPDDRINLWEAAGQPTAEFLGQYGHDSSTNSYVLIGNSNIQIRFTPGQNSRWSLGKLEGATFVEYYVLSGTTGGNPLLGDPDYYSHFDDYSDYSDGETEPPTGSTWNTIQIPVNCLSLPIGQWDSAGYAGTGLATSIIDPIPVAYNEGNTC
jgi:hypothetical protein